MSGELVIHRNVYEMEDPGTLKLKADYAVTGKTIGRQAAISNLSMQQQIGRDATARDAMRRPRLSLRGSDCRAPLTT